MPAKPPSIKQLYNEKALKLYAVYLCGLIALVVLVRWVQEVCERSSEKSRSKINKPLLLIFRKLETRAKWKRLGEPSYMLLALISIFLVINGYFCFNIIAGHQVNYLASRFGWIATANMALCVVFVLRNSLLGVVTSMSHSDFRPLHIIMGYWIAFLVVLHGIFYTIHFGRQGRWDELFEAGNVEGFGAAAAMAVLLIFGYLRQRNYEFFYVSHVAGFVFVLIMLFLHRPDWTKKLPLVVAIITGIWLSDRVFRVARMVGHLVWDRDRVTVYPLPCGGTRLLLNSRQASSSLPGSHCYLWIPQISLCQTHPFTIVSSGPSGLELVIKAQDGFTKDLHDLADQRDQEISWASVDGPYGSPPDVTHCDKLVLVAGGSGAAFTFGLMNRILNNDEKITAHSIDFVWAVRKIEMLSWFRDHLLNITACRSTVNVTIYITGDESSSQLGGSEQIRCIEDVLPKKDFTDAGELESLLGDRSGSGSGPGVVEHLATFAYRKMSTDVVLCRAMQTAKSNERVLVAGCGPSTLIDSLRDSVDGYRAQNEGRIDLHCEDFGS